MPGTERKFSQTKNGKGVTKDCLVRSPASRADGMLGSQSKKEKAKPQQRKRRMITDLPHKASSERGRFVGIFRRAEPMKDFVPMITPLLRACSNATKHIHPQPIGWMRAECRVSPSGEAGSPYGQRKSLGNIGGRRVHPATGSRSKRNANGPFRTALHFG